MKPFTSLSRYAAAVSLWTMVAYNIPFLQFAAQHAECPLWRNVLMIISLVLVLLVLHYMLIYLLVYALRMAGRIILAVFSFLNGVCTYFIFRFHTMMDDSMLSNVFNTRTEEASGFFCWQLWVGVLVMGVLPMVYILARRIDRGSARKMGKHVGIAFGITAVLVLCSMDRMLWFGKYDTELGGLVMPWSYTVNSCRLLAMHHNDTQEEILLPDGKWSNTDKQTVVLVIGESARRANCQLYGYERATNPRLRQVSDLHVLLARSNATYTTAGLKAMMEHEANGKLYEILPNYLYRMGADVQWRSSNWGETPLHIGSGYVNRPTLAQRYGLEEKFDHVLFYGLRDEIAHCAFTKQLIILHTSTSHGPEYQERYPREYAQWDESDVVGAYDNSLLYTDALLADLIDTLRTISDRQVAMIYMSDHGESLGEHGVYMHGAPMAMAPAVQYEIPCWVWFSPGYAQLKEDLDEVDQHGIFHTVVHLLGLNTPVYKAQEDWLKE